MLCHDKDMCVYKVVRENITFKPMRRQTNMMMNLIFGESQSYLLWPVNNKIDSWSYIFWVNVS